MQFQLDVTTCAAKTPQAPPEQPPASEAVGLLRQILEVQKEQLAFLRAAHDASSRWRAFLQRWRGDFPDLSQSCRDALPVLERAYGALIEELAAHLREEGGDALDTDFTLQEFLDRYGVRLAQLGTILNLVAPLAEASTQGETS